MRSVAIALLPLLLAASPFVVAQAAAKQSPFAGSYSGCVEHEYSYVYNGVTYTYRWGYFLAIKIGKNGNLSGDYGTCYNGSLYYLYPDTSVGGTVSDEGSMTVDVTVVYPNSHYCDPYYGCYRTHRYTEQLTIDAHVELDGNGNLVVTTTGGTGGWPAGDSGVLYHG